MMSTLGEENNMSTCIITGAGSGIGHSVAIELSKRKYYDSYVLLGRNINDINKTIEEMISNGVTNVFFYVVDLSHPELIQDIVEDINSKIGNITALYNIAGYTDPQSLFSTSLDSLELTYKINVFSPFVLCRECAKYMKQVGGKIVNVASTAGMTPRPGWISYASSKAAMISISQTLTSELAEYGIKVYCVSPGRCATKLRKRLAPDEDPSTIMQPEEVATIICNLMSLDENCLDGQNIVIRKQIERK